MIFVTFEPECQVKGKQALYFYSGWMPFGSKMELMIERAEEKHKDIAFFAIDVDYFPGLCKRFSVPSIPTIVILSDGKEVKRLNGLVTSKDFMDAFADICSPESHKLEKNHGY